MERIRDYDGRSARRAAEIQSVVGALGQMSALPVIERTEAAQLNRTYSTEIVPAVDGSDVLAGGFDSEGNYHDPQLRLER
jgi:hypothetical protein